MKLRTLLFAAALFLVGIYLGGVINVLPHELGHYATAEFFNRSSVESVCLAPINQGCGGAAGAVIYKGFPSSWAPNFHDDPLQITIVASAGIILEALFATLILWLAGVYLLPADRPTKYGYFLVAGIAFFSVLNLILLPINAVLHVPTNFSDYCNAGYGLSKLVGNSPAQGTCPTPYTALALFGLAIFAIIAIVYPNRETFIQSWRQVK